MTNENRKFDWGSFFIGVVFIIVSMIALRNPTVNLATIVMIFAIAAILEGIYQITIRRVVRKATGYKSTIMIVTGILNLIIGIILLFNIYEGILVLPYVFAIWFILRSVEGLLSSGLTKIVSKSYYWFTIIINIIGIVLGIMLFKNPFSSVMTITYIVGLNFMLFGILNIVEAFSNKE